MESRKSSSQPIRSDRGASMVEYALLLACTSLFLFSAFAAWNQAVADSITKVSFCLSDGGGTNEIICNE